MTAQDFEPGWQPGDRIGEYLIGERLHANPRSWIVRGTSGDGGSRVFKLLRAVLPEPAEIGRFRHEFDLARAFRHPNIVRPLSLEGREGKLFMVMPDDRAVALRLALRSGPLEQAAAVRVAMAVLDALEAIHAAEVIHKDITPGNILMLPGTGVKLIDFGIAAEMAAEPAAMVRPDELEGSLAYMAPEQSGRMNRQVDYRADFYGLGATLFEAITGRPPFAVADAAEAVHAHLARTPPDPVQLRPGLLPALAAVVLRLLAKEPEDRYQTHAALRRALARCLTLLEGGTPDAGADDDQGDRFVVSGHLYGRQDEIAALAAQFESAAVGTARLVLIAGFSGIGKTALVVGAQHSLLAQRGNFIRGKFNQFGQHVPLAAFIAALGQRGRQLLALPTAARARWRSRLAGALGEGARLVADAVADLAPLLDGAPPPTPLPPQQAESRFLRAMKLAIGALADESEPLTLFLDDLQWADRPSRLLLRELAFDPGLRHVLVVAAYRDNEVPPGHPLAADLADLRGLGERCLHLSVGPLDEADVVRLLADSLGAEASDPALIRLAGLCQTKTAGNPFFLRRFLEDLHRRGLLSFDPAARRWRWSLEAIAAETIADNVVELMLGQLRGLPADTRRALTVAAMLGAGFDLASLATALSLPPAEAASALAPAIADHLVLPASGGYRYATRLEGDAVGTDIRYAFAHDRVQEAAYGLIPATERPRLHLEIGRLLLSRRAPQAAVPFEVVNHLNAGATLITQSDERLRLAEMNAEASQAACAAAAFDMAADYAEAALGLGGASAELMVHAARMAYLAGRAARMDALIDQALPLADEATGRARLLEVRVEAFFASARPVDTVELGLEVLAMLGVDLPAADGPGAVAALAGAVKAEIDRVGLEGLAGLAPMTDPTGLLAASVMAKMVAAAYIARPALWPRLTVAQVRLMMAAGQVPSALPAYSMLGIMCAETLGEYRFAYDLGRMSLALVDRHGWREVFAHVAFTFNTFVRHWVDPLEDTLPVLLEVHRNGVEFGNLRHAGLALAIYAGHALLAGHPLGELAPLLADHGAALDRIGQPMARGWLAAVEQAVAALGQTTPADDPMDAPGFPAAATEEAFAARSDGTGLMFLNAWRCLAHLLAGRFDKAQAAGEAAADHFDSAIGLHVVPQVAFWTAVAALRKGGAAAAPAAAARVLEQLERLCSVNPAAFAARRYLLLAEMARAERAPADRVLSLYQAADRAAGGGSRLEAGLAAWLHGSYRTENGLPLASRCLAEARTHLLQWGSPLAAETALPAAATPQRSAVPHSSGGSAVDLASLMKAVQAITAETSLAGLLERLVRVVGENAGARRTTVILADGDDWRLVAEADGQNDAAGAGPGLSLDCAGDRLPVGLVRTVLATGQAILLDDAAADAEWGSDPFISGRHCRSLMCVPLVRQRRMMGGVCLDNDAAAGAFTPARMQFVEMLVATIVNAVENARLNDQLRALAAGLEQRVEQRTRELRESEERVRAILDNAPVPMSVTRRADGILLYVNPPATQLLGYEAEAVIGRPAPAFYADPGERQRLHALYRAAGTINDYETRLRRADGSVRWVLISMVPIRHDGEAADLATVVDITARKEMELAQERLATTDPLTGVANRRRFIAQGEVELARMRRHGEALSLIMMDIDHFKRVNDGYGHACGDEALRQVANSCGRVVRSEDTLGRLGGEEFAVLLPNTTLAAAAALAERLRKAVAGIRLTSADGGEVALSASFGVAQCSAGENLDRLLARADDALYRAKNAGRNRVAVAP